MTGRGRFRAALAACVVALAGCERRGPRTADGRPDAPRIFATQCAPCHGADGRRELPGGKHLSDAADWPLARVRATVAQGQGGVMPAWRGVLAPDELDAVAGYAKDLAAAAR